jgi:hypothetical protein
VVSFKSEHVKTDPRKSFQSVLKSWVFKRDVTTSRQPLQRGRALSLPGGITFYVLSSECSNTATLTFYTLVIKPNIPEYYDLDRSLLHYTAQ